MHWSNRNGRLGVPVCLLGDGFCRRSGRTLCVLGDKGHFRQAGHGGQAALAHHVQLVFGTTEEIRLTVAYFSDFGRFRGFGGYLGLWAAHAAAAVAVGQVSGVDPLLARAALHELPVLGTPFLDERPDAAAHRPDPGLLLRALGVVVGHLHGAVVIGVCVVLHGSLTGSARGRRHFHLVVITSRSVRRLGHHLVILVRLGVHGVHVHVTLVSRPLGVRVLGVRHRGMPHLGWRQQTLSGIPILVAGAVAWLPGGGLGVVFWLGTLSLPMKPYHT